MTKFFIDIGHDWGFDRGAVGIMPEESIVNSVGVYLSQILIKRGHSVRLTDKSVMKSPTLAESLQARVAQSNKFEPDLFISLHANASERTSEPMGVEAFAISRAAKPYGQACIDALVKLGYKKRSLKFGADADHLYVLRLTEDPAILLEIGFVDSEADCTVFNEVGAMRVALAIADAIAPMPSTTTEQPSASAVASFTQQQIQSALDRTPRAEPAVQRPRDRAPLVKDVIGQCNTGLIRGLSLQLIAKMNRLVSQDKPLLVAIDHELIDTSSPACNPFLQPVAAAALIRAVEKRQRRIVINSCLRTIPQQWLIRRQFEKKLCGITAAAQPDRSNHSNGSAIDVQNASDWKLYLGAESWKKLGDWDPPHYDYWGLRTDIAKLQVTAFQMLWNEHNPGDLLVIDGVYGNKTGERIANSPADGF
jgi:hypothetical protein